MNFRIYIMAIAAMAVGLVELLVGGILPVIASDLNVSLSAAGQLITFFALTYAISGPVLYVLTSRFERKLLYLISLFVFCLANVLTYFSESFFWVMVARIVTAAATSLIIILSVTIAARIAEKKHQAKAIGLIFVGVSSSLVFGVPLGVLITEHFGWRIIFLAAAAMALVAMLLIAWALTRLRGQEAIPLSQQLKSLKQPKLWLAQLATILMLAGHFTLYAYFTPYLQESLQLDTNWISIAYFAFGWAAVGGGMLGGILADKLGNQKAIVVVLTSFAASMLVLPFSVFSIWVFIPTMMLWGGLSWSLGPALQSYLIASDPRHGEVQQSFNSSAIQIGISLGSAVGGLVISTTGSTASMAYIGGAIVLLALGCALLSFRFCSASFQKNGGKVEQ